MPLSDIEVITAIFYMICGVAFFSYIMGSFIEILSNYHKKMGILNKEPLLQNWMILLTKFTLKNKPISQ